MQMDTTTQQNAALVEEAAAASQAIVEQAQALNGLVARYNVGDAQAFAAKSSSAPVERRSKDRPWSSGSKTPTEKSAAPAPARKAVANNSAEWNEF
jgi:methyl-accepting chemotaxis protein-1 (serine sensor receptor)